jgi:Family of unknown function (DUF5681)
VGKDDFENCRPYDIGYGRPPLSTRFGPGKSGNPKGRPRGRKSVDAIMKEIMRQKIAVTENGMTRRIPVLEAMLRRRVHDALRGDTKAMNFLLSLNEQYCNQEEPWPKMDESMSVKEKAAVYAEMIKRTVIPLPRHNRASIEEA